MLKIEPIKNANQKLIYVPIKQGIKSRIVDIEQLTKGIKIDIVELKSNQPIVEFNSEEAKQVLGSLGVKNLRAFGLKCLSGETLENKPEVLEKLKQMGATTIVDLRADDKTRYRKLCEEKGLKYFSFPLQNSYSTKSQVENPEDFGKNLKKYFDICNDEPIYVACNYGIDRTNIALSLNYLLNPKTIKVPTILGWDGNSVKSIINKLHKQIKKILKIIPAKQKEDIGITKYDEDNMYVKVKKLHNKNE